MRRAALLLLTLLVAGRPLSAQKAPDGAALLTRYLQGERALTLPAPFNADAFLSSISDALAKGLPGPPEKVRRASAAFVLESAAVRLDAADIPSARRLLEFACARVRAHQPADEFDTAWHDAALSIADAFLDPVALEAHVQHVRAHVPTAPQPVLSWAVAGEQRASPSISPRLPNEPAAVIENTDARRAAERARLVDDAVARLTTAAASPATAADARLRLAHIQLTRQQPRDALTTLAAIETASREGWLIYLARIFRGQALEALDRPDDAITSYRDALKVGPGGHSATMSLTSLLFRRGQRDEAAALVQLLLEETDPISDPWWTYWAGSARQWTPRLKVLRGLIS